MPHECTDCGRAFDDGSKEMLSGCPDCGGTTFQFRPEGAESEESAEPPEPPGPEVDGVARTVGSAASTVRNLVTGGTQSAGAPEPDDGAEAGPADATAEWPATAESDATADATSGNRDESTDEEGETDDGQHVTTTRPEGVAQSDARRDIVEADELPSAPDPPRDRPPVPDPRPLSVREDDGDEDGNTGSSESADGAEEATDSTGADGDGITGENPEERPSLSELRAELNDQFESIRVVAPGRYELNLMELYDREEYIIALQEDGKYTVQLPERWDER